MIVLAVISFGVFAADSPSEPVKTPTAKVETAETVKTASHGKKHKQQKKQVNDNHGK